MGTLSAPSRSDRLERDVELAAADLHRLAGVVAGRNENEPLAPVAEAASRVTEPLIPAYVPPCRIGQVNVRVGRDGADATDGILARRTPDHRRD